MQEPRSPWGVGLIYTAKAFYGLVTWDVHDPMAR